jgi:hypothetical protein
MKRFYLLRHEDLHGHAGLGVVAEGIIFDNGMGSFMWLSKYITVTTFMNIVDIECLHSHEGRTEVIIEGKDERFVKCQQEARRIKSKKNRDDKKKGK